MLFVYKRCGKICFFVYKWRLQWLPSAKDNMHVSIYKKAKKAKGFYIQKARQFPLRFYIQNVWHFMLRNFHEMFEVGIYIKKHETLRYVTFLYTKILTLYKKQDNLRYIYIYKNPDTLRYTIFYWIFEIGWGGGILLYAKNNTLCITFLY